MLPGASDILRESKSVETQSIVIVVSPHCYSALTIIIGVYNSSDIESYLQETGRGGGDGLPATAVLYYDNIEVGNIEGSEMKEYCQNHFTCMRKDLLKNFDDTGAFEATIDMCACCDICEVNCKCALCI